MRVASFIAHLREIRDHATRVRTAGLAAEAAFWLFLGLVPLAAVAGLVAARTTARNWSAFTPIVGSLPAATRDVVTSELFNVSRWNGGAVGIAGVVAFVWLASSGVQALFAGLELETGTVRAWWKRRLLAMLACVASSFVVALIGLLATGIRDVLAWLGRYLPALSFFGSLGIRGRVEGLAASCLIAFAYVCGLYWMGIPADARRRMPLVPGAAIAVVLSVISTGGYELFLRNMRSRTVSGASLAVIGLTPMWLYLLSASVLVGAVVNHSLGLARQHRRSQ